MEPHHGMATPPSGRRRPSEAAPSIQVQQPPDIVTLTHLRWDFVFQRPQHLLTRCARRHRVFLIEEPVIDDGPPRLDVSVRQHGIHVVVPRFPARPPGESAALQAQLLRGFFRDHRIADYVLWYYTPMALEFTRDLTPRAVVYDCMDELSAFAGAPAAMREREQELLARADVVFTGGQSLYESKRHSHPNVHAFPSSVDVAHFARAPSAAAGPRRPGPHPASAAGLLRRGRRADGPRPAAAAVGGAAGLAARDRRAGREDRSGRRCRSRPTSTTSGRSRTTSCRRTWPDGTSRCCRSRATTRPVSSARPRRPSTWPRASPSSRPRSATWCVRTATRGWRESPTTRTEFIAAVEAALAEDAAERLRQVDAFLTQTSWDGTWTRMYRLVSAAMTAADERHAQPTRCLPPLRAWPERSPLIPIHSTA